MATSEFTVSIRLAFRTEGEFVNAYHVPSAPGQPMKDAILLGSMRQELLDRTPNLWDSWRNLMMATYTRMLERSTGITVTELIEMPVRKERSGRA